MLNLMIGTADTGSLAQPMMAPFDVRSLTSTQLRWLGLAQIAYVTAGRASDGLADYVMRGADGVTVAAFDELDLVLEVADRLGLALVPVH
jgi:hypothetical protein